MRILIDARVIGRDGIGRYTRNLINAMVHNEDLTFKSLILLLRDRKLSFKADMTFYDTSSHYTLRELRALTEAVSSSKPQVLHCTDYRVPFPKINVPLVVSLHDIFRFTHPTFCYTNIEFKEQRGEVALSKLQETIETIKKSINSNQLKHIGKTRKTVSSHQLYYAYMIQLLVESADVIIVPTKYVEQQLRSNFSVSAITKVIPYGVNHYEFESAPNFNDNQIEQFKPYIMYVGQARPHKNIYLLLRIFKKLSRQFSELKLVMIGESFTQKSEIKRLIEDNELQNKVVLMGHLEDSILLNSYRHAIALVHLSGHEGFGFTPLEALSQGACIIVSENPTFRELLKDYAIYVNEREESNILAAISSAILNHYDKRLRERRILHSLNYRWEITAQETYQAYNTAINVFHQKRQKNI